jgi:hypothetical protein
MADELTARLDRLESLVGTAFNDDGTVIPALENAARQEDVNQMRHEIASVVGFLRDNNPNRTG